MDSVVVNVFPAIEARQRRELCTSISKLVAEGKDLLMHEISSEGDIYFLLALNLSFSNPSPVSLLLYSYSFGIVATNLGCHEPHTTKREKSVGRWN